MKKFFLVFMMGVLYASSAIDIPDLCKNRNEEECFKLFNTMDARLYSQKDKRDSHLVILGYRTLCEKNYAKACLYLGHKYFLGEGVIQDINKSIELYEKAFEYGEFGAYVPLGELYRKGEVIDKDLNKAKFYFEKACEKDKKNCYLLKYVDKRPTKEEDYKTIQDLDKLCMNGLRSTYCQGIAMLYKKHKDYYNAVRYLQMSCNSSKTNSCYELGKFYLEIQNDKNSYEHYLNIACNNGKYQACYELAIHLENTNMQDSQKFYQKACDLDYKKACAKLN